MPARAAGAGFGDTKVDRDGRRARRRLLFLYEQCVPKIFLHDIKAANTLLVKNHEAFKWVFGLATLLYHGGARHITPRSISTGPTSEKANVFGFGILLLSLVTGQLTFELGMTSGALHRQKGNLLDWSMQARRRSLPWLGGKPHFKRRGMLGVVAIWARDSLVTGALATKGFG